MRYGWPKAGAFAYVAGQRLFAVREEGHRNVRHRIAQERVPSSLTQPCGGPTPNGRFPRIIPGTLFQLRPRISGASSEPSSQAACLPQDTRTDRRHPFGNLPCCNHGVSMRGGLEIRVPGANGYLLTKVQPEKFPPRPRPDTYSGSQKSPSTSE